MQDSKISIQRRIDSISDDFEDHWSPESRLDFQTYLSRIPPQHHKSLLLKLLKAEVDLSIKAGRAILPSDYASEGKEAVDYVEHLVAENSQKTIEQPCHQRHEKLENIELPANLGIYAVERVLGRGGFGNVFLAQDSQGQRVAIKVLHSHLTSDERIQKQFAQEATILERLQHPGIIKFLKTFKTEQGQTCLVTEYLSGGTLDQKINSNDMSPQEVAAFIAKLAGALHQMHLQGFTHRDVKPANILLDELGQPRLADVGLALSDEAYGLGDRLVTGSLAYLSPEQARGDSHLVDGRTDIYSLGIVMYEMLTCRRPFHADETTELLRRIQNIDIKPLRQINADVPQRLEEICLKATDKDATNRYTTAEDLAYALHEFLPPAPSAPHHFLKNTLFRNRKTALGWIGAILLLLAIASVVPFLIAPASGPPRKPPEETTQIRSTPEMEKPLSPELLALHNFFVSEQVLSASQREDWNRVIEIEGKRRDHEPCHYYSLRIMGACVLNSDTTRFKNERMDILVLYEECQVYGILENISKGCLMLPADAETLARVEQLINRAISVEDVEHPEYAITTYGLLDYRKGEYKAAVERTKNLMDHPIKEIRFLSTIISAMANHQLGKLDDAETLLKKSKQMLSPKSRTENYVEWIQSQILYQEASRLITVR